MQTPGLGDSPPVILAALATDPGRELHLLYDLSRHKTFRQAQGQVKNIARGRAGVPKGNQAQSLRIEFPEIALIQLIPAPQLVIAATLDGEQSAWRYTESPRRRAWNWSARLPRLPRQFVQSRQNIRSYVPELERLHLACHNACVAGDPRV